MLQRKKFEGNVLSGSCVAPKTFLCFIAVSLRTGSQPCPLDSKSIYCLSTLICRPPFPPSRSRARPWLLRMQLNREAVFDKRLDVVEIAKKVVGYFDGGLQVIRSDQNSETLVRLGKQKFCFIPKSYFPLLVIVELQRRKRLFSNKYMNLPPLEQRRLVCKNLW